MTEPVIAGTVAAVIAARDCMYSRFSWVADRQYPLRMAWRWVMRMKRGAGFTLVELLIVIAIMGIMATIAVPSYQIFLAQRRLNGAARMVMSDLMAARMKAVSLNQEVKVSFGSDHAYQIWNDADGNGTVANDEGDDIEKDIHPDYYDVTLSKTANPIFSPRGTAALGGTIKLTNSRGSKYVIVALNGRVRISDTPPSS